MDPGGSRGAGGAEAAEIEGGPLGKLGGTLQHRHREELWEGDGGGGFVSPSAWGGAVGVSGWRLWGAHPALSLTQEPIPSTATPSGTPSTCSGSGRCDAAAEATGTARSHRGTSSVSSRRGRRTPTLQICPATPGSAVSPCPPPAAPTPAPAAPARLGDRGDMSHPMSPGSPMGSHQKSPIPAGRSPRSGMLWDVPRAGDRLWLSLIHI